MLKNLRVIKENVSRILSTTETDVIKYDVDVPDKIADFYSEIRDFFVDKAMNEIEVPFQVMSGSYSQVDDEVSYRYQSILYRFVNQLSTLHSLTRGEIFNLEKTKLREFVKTYIESNFCIAGGSISDLAIQKELGIHRDIKDIDVFMTRPAAELISGDVSYTDLSEVVISEFLGEKKGNLREVSVRANGLLASNTPNSNYDSWSDIQSVCKSEINEFKFDFIVSNVRSGIPEIIEGFDLSFRCFWFDGKDVYAFKNSLDDLRNRDLVIINNTSTMSVLGRSYKFHKLFGFNMKPEYHNLLMNNVLTNSIPLNIMRDVYTESSSLSEFFDKIKKEFTRLNYTDWTNNVSSIYDAITKDNKITDDDTPKDFVDVFGYIMKSFAMTYSNFDEESSEDFSSKVCDFYSLYYSNNELKNVRYRKFLSDVFDNYNIINNTAALNYILSENSVNAYTTTIEVDDFCFDYDNLFEIKRFIKKKHRKKIVRIINDTTDVYTFRSKFTNDVWSSFVDDCSTQLSERFGDKFQRCSESDRFIKNVSDFLRFNNAQYEKESFDQVKEFLRDNIESDQSMRVLGITSEKARISPVVEFETVHNTVSLNVEFINPLLEDPELSERFRTQKDFTIFAKDAKHKGNRIGFTSSGFCYCGGSRLDKIYEVLDNSN